MIDVRSQFSAIKASWVGRIVNAPNDHLWAYLPKRYLSKFGENYLIVKSTFTSLKMFPLLKRIPQFYQDIVLSYNKSKVIQYEDFNNSIRKQLIWCNRFIKFRSETLFFKSWIKEGIFTIENLKLTDGKLDINYMSNVVRDKRNFFSEINILQKALKQAKVDISIEPTRNVNIPIFTFITLMKHITGVLKDPNFFMHTCWKT